MPQHKLKLLAVCALSFAMYAMIYVMVINSLNDDRSLIQSADDVGIEVSIANHTVSYNNIDISITNHIVSYNNSNIPDLTTSSHHHNNKNTGLCEAKPHLCDYGKQISSRIKKHGYVAPKSNASQSLNDIVYIRNQPGVLPEWITFFLEYGLDKCRTTCKIVAFEDSSIRAHATVAHQHLIRNEPHEVRVYVNLEADSHSPILECMDSGDETCWYASYITSMRIPMTYSVFTYEGLHMFRGLDWMLSRDANCKRLKAKSEFLKSWFCLLNSLTRAEPQKQMSAMGVAFVSKTCDRHEGYLQTLMSIVPLDMMGDCYKNKDENEYLDYEGGWWSSTREMLSNRDFRKIVVSSKYKFYISIENTILEDYLTEKFWIGFLGHSVMVYLGAPNAEVYAPAPNSFINALDFPDANALGQYLDHLSKHPAKYNQYLAWKNNSETFELNPQFLKHVYNARDYPLGCRLCDQLRVHHSKPQP